MRQETSDCICLLRGSPAWDSTPFPAAQCVLRCCYAETFTSLSSLPAIIHRMTVAFGDLRTLRLLVVVCSMVSATSPQDPLLTTALDGRHQRATLTCQSAATSTHRFKHSRLLVRFKVRYHASPRSQLARALRLGVVRQVQHVVLDGRPLDAALTCQ